jgi:transcriptional regulator with PAS, ATPase and Fis domain
MVERVAPTDSAVLILGESGTGKELVARGIHERSQRAGRPFVPIHCGALPREVLESELFGHEKGAFTGAVGTKPGLIELADGGTLFLDEIGEMEPESQVRLLRVLESGTFFRVGGTRPRRVDVRLVAATNRDLAEAMKQGEFRQDLYYRINVISLELPPLRNRRSDVPALAQTFLNQLREDTGRAVAGFTDEAMAALEVYPWPGNIRELQNVVERAVLLGKGDRIAPSDLPREIASGAAMRASHAGHRTLKEALEGPERQIILEVLEAHGWNRNATADALGVNRTTLYKKMKRLGLEDEAYAER